MAQENCGGMMSSSTSPSGSTARQGATFGNNDFPMLLNNRGLDVFPAESEITSPPVPVTSFPEQIGMNVPAFLDYIKGSSGIAKVQNFGGGLADAFEYVEGSSCGFVPSVEPAYPRAQENWGIQCNGMPTIGNPSFKLGRYTVEERKNRILKYLKKRNQRNFNKTIKYACRKTLADRRVRVRGRFVRNNEFREEDNEVKKNDNSQQENERCWSDALMVRNDDDDDEEEEEEEEEEERLQEPIASLAYVPYISG